MVSLFSSDEVAFFRRLRLSDVIRATTSLGLGDIQDSAFFWHVGDPCPQPSQLNSSLLEPCVFLRGFDYFQVSAAYCVKFMNA